MKNKLKGKTKLIVGTLVFVTIFIIVGFLMQSKMQELLHDHMETQVMKQMMTKAEIINVQLQVELDELEAIAGCTIGGVSTTGGIGTVSGILVGVLVFELLKIVLQFLGVNPYYNYIVQGLVIVVAVALDIRKYVRKK